MKIILQRVKQAAVKVEGKKVAEIGKGICLLVGVEKGDGEEDAQYLANKIVELRIFPDEQDKMNLSLLDIHGEALAVSQFTLAATLRKGRRPSFDKAEEPQKAKTLFEYFFDLIEKRGIKAKKGVFGALMEVELINDGPVTFILDSKKLNKA